MILLWSRRIIKKIIRSFAKPFLALLASRCDCRTVEGITVLEPIAQWAGWTAFCAVNIQCVFCNRRNGIKELDESHRFRWLRVWIFLAEKRIIKNETKDHALSFKFRYKGKQEFSTSYPVSDDDSWGKLELPNFSLFLEYNSGMNFKSRIRGWSEECGSTFTCLCGEMKGGACFDVLGSFHWSYEVLCASSSASVEITRSMLR